MSYTNNKREGITKSYYKSGKVYSEKPYINNKAEGIEKTYYESGKPKHVLKTGNNKFISGICYKPNGEQRPVTDEEIGKMNNNFVVGCE